MFPNLDTFPFILLVWEQCSFYVWTCRHSNMSHFHFCLVQNTFQFFLMISSFSPRLVRSILVSQIFVDTFVDILISLWEHTLYDWILLNLWRFLLWPIWFILVNVQHILETNVIFLLLGGVNSINKNCVQLVDSVIFSHWERILSLPLLWIYVLFLWILSNFTSYF